MCVCVCVCVLNVYDVIICLYIAGFIFYIHFEQVFCFHVFNIHEALKSLGIFFYPVLNIFFFISIQNN